MDASFWNAQRRAAAVQLTAALSAAEAALDAAPVTAAQRAELDHRDALAHNVKTLTNAAKRKAAQELEQWTARHAGPVWRAAADAHATYKRTQTECLNLRTQLDAVTSTDHTARVAPIIEALRDWGAVAAPDDDAGTGGVPVLTRFGVLATEVNESNPLLIAQLYESQVLKGAPAEQIVAVLAATIVDRESADKTVHPYDLPPLIPDVVKRTLVTMDEWGQRGTRIDARHGIESPEYFWSLSTLWVQIAYDWLVYGKSAAEIATTYGMYEGNLMRGIHKLSAIVNEWMSMATYLADVDMLETMKNVPEMILRDIAVPESLYLRL